MKVSRPSRDFWGHVRCGSTTGQGARGESWGHVIVAARVAVEAVVEVGGHISLGFGSLGWGAIGRWTIMSHPAIEQ